MVAQQQIDSEIARINAVWANPQARDGLYGNILKKFVGFSVRGLTRTGVEFSWPVSVIAGTNGSGKTTILQLCSTAYQRPNGGGRDFKIGDWVRSAIGQETSAVNESSAVGFSFWNDEPNLIIPYQPDRTRWGYPRRGNPTRNVIFVGIATYAPRIERKDRLHVFRSRLDVRQVEAFTNEVLTSISTVLGVTYDGGQNNTVGLPQGDWVETMPQVRRGNYVYGEPHMGAGEQKIVRLINALESVPRKSLILLEEPEITLHPDAQRGLAWYLMNLSRRKGHQIILTTHSTDLFETLPAPARLLLVRSRDDVSVLPRAPTIKAARQLAGVVKTNNELILVEDEVGKRFLLEILRRYDRALFEGCSVVPVGSVTDVYRLTQSFRSEGCRAVGVRDPDVGEDPVNAVFSLPGDLAPESLLLQNDNLVAGEQLLNGLLDAYGRARVFGLGRTGSDWSKHVFRALAAEMRLSLETLSDRLTLAWLGRNDNDARLLVGRINAALNGQ